MAPILKYSGISGISAIAAAVAGGASLSGGRASVVGAVIGALIFAVLRNALAQIPGGRFADRLILSAAVLVIVVLDRADAVQPQWPRTMARSTPAAIRVA